MGSRAARLGLQLVHWNEAEARERAARLRALGHRVDATVGPFPGFLKRLGAAPPDAVVIDLGRLPSQGRDVGIALRTPGALRRVPIVFVDGAPDKVAAVKRHLPDAVYTTWKDIDGALRGAVARPPADPVVPASRMAGYAGAPLARKLGIRENARILLAGAPPDFASTLDPLPAGARVLRRAGPANLTLWFPRDRAALERGVGSYVPRSVGGGLWIVWAKQASGRASDLTQAVVRRVGLAAGMVDYKIAAIDATFSGLRFTQRQRTP